MTDTSSAAPPEHPQWDSFDLLRWKLMPERFGGGRQYIQQFKNSWVRHNRLIIIQQANAHQIPPELLAGTAWIEVGGDPSFIDGVAYDVRSFDWSGPEWVDRNMTITRRPETTSFGSVSMQLRTAAQTLGMDPRRMRGDDWDRLRRMLENDTTNLELVARHLRQLALQDFPGQDTRQLTPERIEIIGARYNRGTGLSLEQIRRNVSYGRFINRKWRDMRQLLYGN
jgi:hypothetical protein